MILSKISKDLLEISAKQLQCQNVQDTERLKELIDMNAATIQEYYDFKLKVI